MLTLLWGVGQMTVPAVAETQHDVLPVTYFPWPPYIYDGPEGPTGPHVLRFLKITDKAALKVSWLRTTVEGETKMLNQGRRAFCSTGKLYNQARAKLWQFLPYAFALAPKSIILTRPDKHQQVSSHRSFEDLLKNASLTGALLGGATYGQDADDYLATGPAWIVRTGTSDVQLINMVLAGRADYAAVQEMQWSIAQARTPAATSLVQADTMIALPAQPIFLACSRNVPAGTMTRLENALKQLGFKRWALPN